LTGTETILLVEDQHDVRRLMAEMLEKQGYRVLKAANGKEAAAACNKYEKEIDLLITDVIMPGINGPALAKKLTMLKPGMRILYVSGYTSNIIIHQGFLDPDVAFLQKPFSSSTLVAKVREVLSQP
jgi:two-component system, cell cycle sensor histidine kinase and response regulator CckA